MSDRLIQVENLKVTFKTQGGDIEAVRGVSFDINTSENVAIVGESGSGKSVTALSLLKLHDSRVVDYPDGRIFYDNQDLMLASESRMRSIRGRVGGKSRLVWTSSNSSRLDGTGLRRPFRTTRKAV